MLVTCLVSWAGERFAYQPGEVIELDEVTAQERIAAGLAAVPQVLELPVLVETSTTAPRKRAIEGDAIRGRI